MAVEEIAIQTPPEEIQQAPPEVPVQEPLDPSGVPYKNRVAEWQRKAEEAESLNRQLQQALGTYLQQQQQQGRPPVTPSAADVPEDPEEAQLDPVSRKLVYKIANKVAQQIAERTGYRFVAQAEHQQAISGDPELYEEAKKQYATFKQHPMWQQVDDTLVQNRAIAEARAVMAEKRKQVATTVMAQNANRTVAPTASVPPTQPNPVPATPPGDKQKWVSQYVAQPETLQMFRMFEGHRYNPNDENDKRKMLETAEEAYKGTVFTGATAKAYQAFKSGAAETMLGTVEEV